MKRFFYSRLISTVLFLLAFTACQEKDPVTETLQQPEGYQELIQAYNDGKVISEISKRFGINTLTFADGTVFEISDVDFEIHDCRSSAPLDVTIEGERWKVGTRLTDIKVHKDLTNEQAYPVYVYYNLKTLHMHLSNRQVLSFWSLVLEEDKKKDEQLEALEKFQNIPVVSITTFNNAPILDKKNYVDGTITIKDSEKLFSVMTEFTADMGIRGRGNSTWGFPKKPWKVKLDKAAPILGMPSDKEWALLANYTDRTLMRNMVAMKMSEICGFSWTPRMRHVEVYLNDVYQGVYTFCEHKKVSEDRINIDPAGENDNSGEALTGDYYIEIEAAMDEPVAWRTGMGVPLMFSDPDEPTGAQIEYIKGLFEEFEAVLYSDHLADPERGYAAYIDVDSFIDYYIVQEIAKNIDGNLFKSAFVTKEKGKKFEMYHLWDFDLTFGNCGYFHSTVGNGPDNFWIRDVNSYSQPGHNWFNRMMQDPAFVDRLKKRWNELKPEFDKIPDYIDEQAFILSKAAKHNFSEAWSIKESIDWVMMPSLGSYEAEVAYFKYFYTERLNWLDIEINKM